MAPPFDGEEGAEASFLGVVRATEDGRRIRGIEYSAYEAMAREMLGQLHSRAFAELGAHRVYVHHRIGFVAAGEPSVIIQVRAKHSSAAFELCQWYLREIKTRTPIWKQPVWV